MNTIRRDDDHLVWELNQDRPLSRLMLTGGLGLILTLGGLYYLVDGNTALGVITLIIGIPLAIYGITLWRREYVLTIAIDRPARTITLSGAQQRIIPADQVASITIARSGYEDAPFYAVQIVLDDSSMIPVTPRRGRRTPLEPDPLPEVTANRDEIAHYLDLP